jgi:hypothetical protein
MLDCLLRGKHRFLGPAKARKLRLAIAAVLAPFESLAIPVRNLLEAMQLEAMQLAESGEVTLEERATANARESTERARQAAVLRDLFGPLLFRPVAIDPAWLAWNGGVVPALARAIDEGASEQLPVLADALEDAGCTSPDLLGHLRGPGPHFRGCWVIDLLLTKS